MIAQIEPRTSSEKVKPPSNSIIIWLTLVAYMLRVTRILDALLTAPMPAVYGLSGITAWLIFTLFLATIASAFPARRASRLTVRDTLAYE